MSLLRHLFFRPKKEVAVILGLDTLGKISALCKDLPYPIADALSVQLWHDPRMLDREAGIDVAGNTPTINPDNVYIQPDPGTSYGLSILVHELTHVYQRRSLGLVRYVLTRATIIGWWLHERQAFANETMVVEKYYDL